MKYLPNLFILCTTILITGCSLLKFQIETDVEPLPQKELNTRLAVRSFYNDFVNTVMTASDSIVKTSPDTDHQINAIRWKINSTAACSRAAFQSIPEASLVDTWVLCLQMEQLLQTDSMNRLLGEYTPVALRATQTLSQSIDKLAKNLNKQDHYKELIAFTQQYARKHPLTGLKFSRKSLVADLTEFLEIPDTAYVTTIGSGAEVMNDLTERIGIYNDQIKYQLEWQKDLLTIKWDRDSIDERFLARADSLSLMLDRLANVAEESPEILGSIAVRLRQELSPMIYDLNHQLSNSIGQISREREELQKYLDTQRAIITEDINQTGQQMIETATENLIKLIRKIIVYVILLIVVLFGIPFGLGFALGRIQLKKRSKE
ncbi:hypothetical protein DMA11_19325 [Marinilabiliaceae bacterium JC017]|nr:hypothetical protein DMA11_19325 [Marinilabiliaceae bacterium JC017]